MATSPLDPSNLSGRKDRILGRGHGTRALGPSDSSDSGSDLVGAASVSGDDVGDANLDSDSDRNGTGETAAASRDEVPADGADIDADHIEALPLDELADLDEASLANAEDLGRDDDEENER